MKSMIKFNSILITVLLTGITCSAQTFSENPKKAVQWQRWQHELKSDGSGNKPVTLGIVFTGPQGKTFTTQAFTDDGKSYYIRASFPAAGVWRWKSVCNTEDPGLHNKDGKIKVSKYKGSNPLYKHGDLKISDDRRYLVHADGTPFLWMGETGWNATLKSTIDEWRYYVDTRARQGFTLIQISPRGSGNRNIASAAPEISVNTRGTPDPVFWSDLDEKIAYANDKGIFILMVGTGSAWRDLFAKNPANQKFETYLTGRLASHMVIFSPSFDQLFIDELDKVAIELQKSTQHLVTQHPGTNYEANLKYRNTSVDFCGLQSGHHGGNLTRVFNAARQWTLDMWNGTPVKPVVNIEAMYDAYGHNDAKNWRENDARKPGWISWLSGSRGFTYGCGDIPPKVPIGHGAMWLFNKDSTTYDFWKKAINWPSAGHMTIMKDFFGSVEWWKLIPAHELVIKQAEDETLKMVVSKSSDSKFILAYLPDNPAITLDLKEFPGPFNAVWLNPASGEYVPVGTINSHEGMQEFKRPNGWEDAVLKITR